MATELDLDLILELLAEGVILEGIDEQEEAD
jgi:hypothetical protein